MSVCAFAGVPKYTAKSAAPLVKYEEKNTEALFSILVWLVAEKMADENTLPMTIEGSVGIPLDSREINSGAVAPFFIL
jgi:hypothetical protein